MSDHPCHCDKCYAARDDELRRARDATLEICAEFIDNLGSDTEQRWPPSRIALAIRKLYR